MTATQPVHVPRARALTRLIAAAVFCVVALVVLQAVFLDTKDGQRLDDAALRGRVVQKPRARDASERLLRTISVGSLALIGGGIMLIAAARGRGMLAIGVGGVIVGSNVTTQLLKHVLERPDFVNEANVFTFNSLPSGHTTVATSLAAALVLAVPPRVRPFAANIGALYATGIASMTLAAGWHRPSDAIAAFAVVGAWAFGMAAALVALRGTDIVQNRASIPVLAAGLALVLLVGFTALIATTSLAMSAGVETVKIGIVFLFAAGTIVGIGVALFASLVLLLRGISLDSPRHELART